MKIKTQKSFIGSCLLLMIAISNSFAQNSINREAEVQRVIESFRISLIKKDKPLFLSLFLEGNIGWQFVTEDKSLLRLKIQQPIAVKTSVNPKDNHLSFIDFITKTEKTTEETFSNIKVNTDGDVASVTFDYTFLYDKLETNYGQEHWLLVRTETGWKITSVVWSETLPLLIKTN